MVEEYEYTAHSSVAHSYYLPVAKFHFELSPMQVGFNILLAALLISVTQISHILLIFFLFLVAGSHNRKL